MTSSNVSSLPLVRSIRSLEVVTRPSLTFFYGNRVIKITMTKDVPGIVSIAAFECHLCYRRQPASSAVCKKLGNRSRSSPLNGLCRPVLPPRSP